jgi:hypothetical protein
MHLPAPCGLVTLLSDFGLRDPYVGIMKGAVKLANPRAEVMDLCHAVPPQDLEIGAFYLAAALGRFPIGTVHVAVVDPGVGTTRRALVAHAAACYWIAPDNGLATRLLDLPDAEVRIIDVERLGIRPESSTFHGRDVFGPLAGRLSKGQLGFRALGPPCPDPVRLTLHTAPRIVLVDRFGNLISNVDRNQAGEGLEAVQIAGVRVPMRRTYGEVEAGELLALYNSYGMIEVAVAQGSAHERLGVGRGQTFQLVFDQDA